MDRRKFFGATLVSTAGLVMSTPSNASMVSTGQLKYFNNVDLAKVDESLVEGDIVFVKDFTDGDGGAGTYDVVLSSNVSPDGYLVIRGTTKPSLSLVLRPGGHIVRDIRLNVPTDFPDLQTALNYWASSTVAANINITIEIESGHLITGGIGVFNGDFGHFIIYSSDEVLLAPSFTGVAGVEEGDINGEVPNPPLFYGLNATMPQLNALINMEKREGTGTGYMGVNSTGFIHPGKGVINAGFRGLQWRNGNCFAAKACFNGARGAGIRLHQTAQVNAFGAQANECCKIDDLDLAAIYVSRSSQLEFRDGSAKFSGASGMLVRRSIVTARGANVSSAEKTGLHVESASLVDAIELSAMKCTEYGIRCGFTSKVAAHSAVMNENGWSDVFLEAGGEIGINDLTRTRSGTAVEQGVEKDYKGIDFFNVQTGAGIVISQNAESAIQNVSTQGKRTVRFADGTQTVELTANLHFLKPEELYAVISFPENYNFSNRDYMVSVTLPTASQHWAKPDDRAKVSFSGWSTRLENSVTVVCHGSDFTSDSKVNEVLITCTGRWK